MLRFGFGKATCYSPSRYSISPNVRPRGRADWRDASTETPTGSHTSAGLRASLSRLPSSSAERSSITAFSNDQRHGVDRSAPLCLNARRHVRRSTAQAESSSTFGSEFRDKAARPTLRRPRSADIVRPILETLTTSGLPSLSQNLPFLRWSHPKLPQMMVKMFVH